MRESKNLIFILLLILILYLTYLALPFAIIIREIYFKNNSALCVFLQVPSSFSLWWFSRSDF